MLNVISILGDFSPNLLTTSPAVSHFSSREDDSASSGTPLAKGQCVEQQSPSTTLQVEPLAKWSHPSPFWKCAPKAHLYSVFSKTKVSHKAVYSMFSMHG